jgi:hypothetical protein
VTLLVTLLVNLHVNLHVTLHVNLHVNLHVKLHVNLHVNLHVTVERRLPSELQYSEMMTDPPQPHRSTDVLPRKDQIFRGASKVIFRGASKVCKICERQKAYTTMI